MISACRKGQGSLEYLLLIGGSVVVAVIVIFIVLSLPQSAGNVAQTGIESYREVVGIKVTANPVAEGGGIYATGSEITFSANPSSGTEPYTCNWDFGDGATATNNCKTSVLHTYATTVSVTYTATVTVTDDSTPPETSSPKKITVNIVQVGADISFNPASSPVSVPSDTGEAGSITVSCTNKQPADSTTCNWSIATTPTGLGSFEGGGATATGNSVTYNLDTATPGIYNFTLTVGSPIGSTERTGLITTSIEIALNPVAEGGGVYAVGSEVTFSANPSKGSGNYTCNWDFGDGTALYTDGCPTSETRHTYSATGPYTVTVTVTDAEPGYVGSSNTTTVEIALVGADISFNPASSPVSVPSDTGEAGGITVSCADKQPADATCGWSVATTPAGLGSFAGGGATVTGDSVTYNLDTSTPGTYSFTLNIDSPIGSTIRNSSITTRIEIDASPVASAPATGSSYKIGESIAFTANRSNGTAPYSFAWDFGDGATSAAENPTHNYAREGTYTVTLEATDSAPKTVTKTLQAGVTFTNPVALWKLDEGGTATTTADLYGGYNGTLKGANGLPSWITGISGNALSFDGVDDFVISPTMSSLNTSNGLTLSAWINPTSSPTTTTWVGILAFGGNNWPQYYSTHMAYTSGKKLFCYTMVWTGDCVAEVCGAGDLGRSIVAVTEIPINRYSHVVCSFYYNAANNRTYVKGYLNGVQESSGDASGLRLKPLIARPAVLGAITNSYYPTTLPIYFFNGTIDEVAVYDKALSPEEIKRHYCLLAPPGTAGC